MDALFEVAGARAHASGHTAGPWDPTMQHGGAPASLVAWLAGRIETQTPMRVVRMTLDLLRPVPLGDLDIRTEVVREGRKIQLCAASLSAGGKEVVRASVLKVRVDDAAGPQDIVMPPLDHPLPGPASAIDGLVQGSSPYARGLDIRAVRGGFGERGPGACWFRSIRPIVAGEATTPLMRAAAAADFCNGVSWVLDQNWTFLNGDLSINFVRMPVGEWILLDAETWIGDGGAGMAAGRLADERGYFGRVIQNLVIEKR
jgi:hypothetical protein